MRAIPRSLLVYIIVLVGCAPQGNAVPSLAPAPTHTPIPTAILEPIQIPEPTSTPAPTPTPLNQIPNDAAACAEIVEAKTSSAGVFEVVFEDSEFGAPAAGDGPGFAMWSEDTQAKIPFPLPSDADHPELSTDHRRVLFQRGSGDGQSELWVMDADGQNRKRLAAIRVDEETKARYPDAGFLLNYSWLPNAEKIVYSVEVFGEFGPATIIQAVLVDVDSGMSDALPIPPEVNRIIFAPDGSQLAVITETGTLGFSAQDGRSLFDVQISLNNPIYSPDGSYLIAFIDEGLLRIDTRDGQQHRLPFPYAIMEGFPAFEGPVLSPLPDLIWLDNSTLRMSSMNSGKEYVTRPLETDPNDWTFTIWEINLADGAAQPRQTFNGDPRSVSISPDGTRLAFFKIELSNSPESLHLTRLPGHLHLADLNTGEILETIAEAGFEAWSPDSAHYVYSRENGGNGTTGQPITEVFLGGIGEEPIFIGNIEGYPLSFNWPDTERFGVFIGSCATVGYETIALIPVGQPAKITIIP